MRNNPSVWGSRETGYRWRVSLRAGLQGFSTPSRAEGALCLTCDAEFRGQPSWSVMVAAPFAVGSGQAIVCGICPDCAGHPDLQGVVVERLRHRPSGHAGSGAELAALPCRSGFACGS